MLRHLEFQCFGSALLDFQVDVFALFDPYGCSVHGLLKLCYVCWDGLVT